jgi:hypothetical protein
MRHLILILALYIDKEIKYILFVQRSALPHLANLWQKYFRLQSRPLAHQDHPMQA